MVFKRRYSKRKRFRRKSKRMVRRITRVPKSMLVTKRFVYRTAIAGSDTTSTYAEATAFQASQIPAFSEVQNLFEHYKISGIKYRWVITKDPDWTGASISGTTGLSVRIMHVIDRNDITTPASLAELQQYNNVKEDYLNSDRPVTRWRFFRPNLLTQVGGQFGNVNTIASKNPWVTTASPSAFYYGIKWFLTENQAGQQVRLECYYYFAAKGVN